MIDEPNNPDSLDPATSFSSNGVEITMNTNMPLIFYAKGSYTQYIPVLAQSWNESSDGKTYTFALRQDIHFSNGDPFNAYVVWYNIYRGLVTNSPVDFVFALYFNSSGVTAGDLNSFNNAQNNPSGNNTLLQIMQNTGNAVTVVNFSVVQFHLTYAFSPFLGTVVGPPWEFIDPYLVGQHGGVVANTPNSWMSVNGSSFGDGPYVVKTFIPNQFTILVRNPNYWAQNVTGNYILAQGAMSQITLNYKTDELTRSLDLENKRAQGGIVTFNDVNNVLKASSSLYIPNLGPSGDVESFLINTEKAPLNNTLVRQAIVDSINITQIQQSVYEGYIIPVVGPEPTNIPYYNSSITPPSYNVTKAKQLLVQAGHSGGSGIPPLTLVFPQSEYVNLIAQILVQDFAQIGITLQPKQLSYDTYTSVGAIQGNQSGAPNFYYSDWTFYPDFSGYEYLIDAQLGIFPYFNNQTIHSLVIQSNSELNSNNRAHEISQIMFDVQQQAGVIWLGQAIDLFETGGGFGPEVWNHCVGGMWYSAAFMSVDFNSLSYTCTP
ncbi:MAG: ABC transporter substrate-binding protein [Thaumarchaeota archaeon]|nr:ABC transporter substrate-binding protein [Nitrososphaerota archaeon]